MQTRSELEDLSQKFFKKKKVFEGVYKSLKEYENESIERWFVYQDYASFGALISMLGLIAGMVMVHINAKAYENSKEPTLPGGVTLVASGVFALLCAFIVNVSGDMRRQNDTVNFLDKEQKKEMKQLLAWFDIKPSKKVTSSLWDFQSIKNIIECRKKARTSFLSCLDHPDSTIPATLPKELVPLILHYAGLLAPETNQLVEKAEVNTLTC